MGMGFLLILRGLIHVRKKLELAFKSGGERSSGMLELVPPPTVLPGGSAFLKEKKKKEGRQIEVCMLATIGRCPGNKPTTGRCHVEVGGRTKGVARQE